MAELPNPAGERVLVLKAEGEEFKEAVENAKKAADLFIDSLSALQESGIRFRFEWERRNEGSSPLSPED